MNGPQNQELLARTERRLQQVHEEITAVQGAVAAGLRIELRVDPCLTGTVIGKKVRTYVLTCLYAYACMCVCLISTIDRPT